MHPLETTVLYLRISADQRGDELGVDRQEYECRDLCERNGWEVSQVYVDNDISATKGKPRPAFEELLAARPARIVCWHTDRLVRVSKDLERVLDLGVPVYTVTSGWLDLSNPAGRAVARTVTAWATYEGEQKALRQKAAHAQRRREGKQWWMHKPFGYNMDGTVVPTEADAIRQACTDLLDGKAIRAIAREWEQKGFRSSRGNTMSPSVVRTILKHPRNAAKVTYQDDIVGNGDWEPIIDELLLYAVRRYVMDSSRIVRASSKRKGLLSGLLYCAECGSRVHLYRSGAARERSYACSGSRCVTWPLEWLDGYVIERTKLTLLSQDWSQLPVDDPLRQEVSQEVERLERMLDELMEDRLSGILTREQWQNATNKASERLSDARNRLSGPRMPSGPSAALRRAKDRLDQWNQLDVETQREVIGVVYPKITIGRSGRTRWTQPDPKAIDLGV